MPVCNKFSSIAALSFCLLPSAFVTEVAAQEPAPLCPSTTVAFDFKAIQSAEPLAQDVIKVSANDAEIFDNERANFGGDVIIRRNNQWLFTESAQINQQQSVIDATGGVRFTDGYINVYGESFNFDGGTEVAKLRQTQYEMSTTNARGQAEQLEISPQHVNLLGSSFTTCPADNPAWQLTAERIEIDEESDFGRAWGAKLELFDVPVFYLPYFTFPVTENRKSGFLYPTIDSSSLNGVELEAPYYFNIAPNMDATVAPVLMSERGVMLKTEYRYLFADHAGQVNVNYLPSDDARVDNADRYLWHVNHNARFNEHWSAYLDVTQISDDNYLNDFGSEFAGRADTHLYRVAQLDYVERNWHLRMRTEDYELLGQFRSPYRTLPQLSLNYQSNQLEGLSLDWYNELTYFQNQVRTRNYATRIHSAPSLNYWFEEPAFDAEAEVSYLVTHYRQQNDNPALEDEVTRALPRARLRGRLNLERYFSQDGNEYRQTLEPQIQYLFVPYENQQNIGIYDTTLMQDDYNGLFRAQRFSGLDRIAEANQVTYGVSSSLFDQNERERLRLSLGQIYYFDDSRTQLLDSQSQVTSSNSEWVGDINWAIDSSWSLRSSIQYDTELNRTRKSQTALEYRLDNKNLVQINHRKATNILNSDIEQMGTQAVWQLSNQWQVAANVYYDLSNDRVNDAILGVQYSSCCWALRVSAYRRINRDLESASSAFAMQAAGNPAQFDNGVSLQFIISGLSSDSNSLIDMLEKSIYGYRRPFYLSN
ncbi:LPS-assembly protein [Idiomarina aquatica]|uniref:LPS-assembly protein LptD n=1 Tax=Idiomarina aquatica TaxID=1327752 RepID=A0A4R6P4T3_9GAMM|nr:LPS-assembly protein [Idiomarina aquatica]